MRWISWLIEKHLDFEGGLPSMELATTFLQMSITDLIKNSSKILGINKKEKVLFGFIARKYERNKNRHSVLGNTVGWDLSRIRHPTRTSKNFNAKEGNVIEYVLLSLLLKSHILQGLRQASATYGTRAKRGTWNDFQWHADWIEIQ